MQRPLYIGERQLKPLIAGRPEYTVPVNFYGKVVEENGKRVWTNTQVTLCLLVLGNNPLASQDQQPGYTLYER